MCVNGTFKYQIMERLLTLDWVPVFLGHPVVNIDFFQSPSWCQFTNWPSKGIYETTQDCGGPTTHIVVYFQEREL